MSLEREKVEFTEKEKLEIAKVAQGVASGGQELVWDTVRVKVKLMQIAVLGMKDGMIVDGVYFTPKQLLHEVNIVDEVLKQAEFLLQFSQGDMLSILDKRIEGLGVGSVFDPESEISKRINGRI